MATLNPYNTQEQTWVQPPAPPGSPGNPIPTPKPVDKPPQVGPFTPAVGGQPLIPPNLSTTQAGSTTVAPPLGTQTPAQVFPTQGSTSIVGSLPHQSYTPVGDEAQRGLGYLNEILGSNSPLMRNARLTGLEHAAARGLQNSSIAAGTSQRAALDTAMPLVGMAQDSFNQREQRQWQTGEREGQQGWQTSERLGQQDWQSGESRQQRDWTYTQNQLDRDQQITMSEVTNWLNNETFQREFNAQLALLPIQNTTQLLNAIAQQAITHPEIYTADVASGLSEFFTTNFLDVLSRYFPSLYTQTGGA